MQCIGYISQKLNVVTSEIFIARITRLCGPDFLFLSLSDHNSISKHKNSNCSGKISSQVKEAPKKKYTMESTDPRQLREAREWKSTKYKIQNTKVTTNCKGTTDQKDAKESKDTTDPTYQKVPVYNRVWNRFNS